MLLVLCSYLAFSLFITSVSALAGGPFQAAVPLDTEGTYSLSSGNECEKNVVQALKKILDPELKINIVDLGLLEAIQCPDEGDTLSITIILTSPFCPYIKSLVEDIRTTARKTVPHKNVLIIVDTKTRWKASRMTKKARKELWGSE